MNDAEVAKLRLGAPAAKAQFLDMYGSAIFISYGQLEPVDNGSKNANGNAAYVHDRALSLADDKQGMDALFAGDEEGMRSAMQLIELFGLPGMIIHSPYRSTRKLADIYSEFITMTNRIDYTEKMTTQTKKEAKAPKPTSADLMSDVDTKSARADDGVDDKTRNLLLDMTELAMQGNIVDKKPEEPVVPKLPAPDGAAIPNFAPVMVCDVDLSPLRTEAEQEGGILLIADKTARYEPPFIETGEAFNARVATLLQKYSGNTNRISVIACQTMMDNDVRVHREDARMSMSMNRRWDNKDEKKMILDYYQRAPSSGPVWFVTHPVVIREIAAILGLNMVMNRNTWIHPGSHLRNWAPIPLSIYHKPNTTQDNLNKPRSVSTAGKDRVIRYVGKPSASRPPNTMYNATMPRVQEDQPNHYASNGHPPNSYAPNNYAPVPANSPSNGYSAAHAMQPTHSYSPAHAMQPTHSYSPTPMTQTTHGYASAPMNYVAQDYIPPSNDYASPALNATQDYAYDTYDQTTTSYPANDQPANASLNTGILGSLGQSFTNFFSD